MHTSGKTEVMFDGYLYTQNRRNFPVEELQKYAGQWVAFSTQGDRIVESDADFFGLCAKLDGAGIDSASVVVTQIHPDEVGLA